MIGQPTFHYKVCPGLAESGMSLVVPYGYRASSMNLRLLFLTINSSFIMIYDDRTDISS